MKKTLVDFLIHYQKTTQIANFYKKNNLEAQLADKVYLIIVPSDDQLKEFAGKIGISVEQLVNSETFTDQIMYNNFCVNVDEDLLEHPTEFEDEWESVNGELFDVNLYFIDFFGNQLLYLNDELLVTDDQVMDLIDEFPFLDPKGSKFPVMDVSTVSNILVNLEPKEVLQTCRLNKQFNRYCNNETLFTFLMKKHYPTYEIQNDSALKTYKSIVKGTYNYYIIIDVDLGSHQPDFNYYESEILVKEALFDYVNYLCELLVVESATFRASILEKFPKEVAAKMTDKISTFIMADYAAIEVYNKNILKAVRASKFNEFSIHKLYRKIAKILGGPGLRKYIRLVRGHEL